MPPGKSSRRGGGHTRGMFLDLGCRLIDPPLLGLLFGPIPIVAEYESSAQSFVRTRRFVECA